MKNEIWKDIKNYEGLYQVSNLGRVKSLNRIEKSGNKFRKRAEKILTQNITQGYKYVNICKNNKIKTYRIHRLVAETFLPNPEKLPQVNHIDGNKLNNDVNNLEWCSCKHNIQEAYRLGLSKTTKVKQYTLSGTLIKSWNSIAEAGKKLNLDTSAISKCCRGKRKKVGNYMWKY